MKLSPGDTIQVILTVGGVPYAKTHVLDVCEPISRLESSFKIRAMFARLCDDIDLYADEPAIGD
jgi:hypothetical protein